MKIKTLKDLEHYDINDIHRKEFIGIAVKQSYKNSVLTETFPIFIFEEHLKQEAIKWRNNIPQLWEEWFAEYFKSKTTKKLFGEWLLDKIFNITEDELK